MSRAKLSEPLKSTFSAVKDLGSGAGKIAAKGISVGAKAIPVAGAIFGARDVYKTLRERGYDHAESGLLATAAGAGFIGTDFLNLAGPKGFTLGLFVDELINQAATNGYDSIRSFVAGAPKARGEREVPEDVLGSLPKGTSIEDANRGIGRSPQSLDDRGQNVLKRAVQKYDKS